MPVVSLPAIGFASGFESLPNSGLNEVAPFSVLDI